MMRTTEAARALGGRTTGADIEFRGVSTDTRSLKAGDLFVALRGERFDGHGFIAEAAAGGAVAAMVDTRAAIATSMPLVIVEDTRRALGQLAAHWRRRFKGRVTALTGSSGKTTVKEMLASILRAASSEAEVLATRGNLNNDIGVPLTLFELSGAQRYAVVEMGMNHEGEIRYLTGLAAPDVALVTNAGRAHIEFLGSEEAIARAKGEIFEGLGPGGTAVINADDKFAPMWRERAGLHRRVEFGIDHDADVTASYRMRPLESEIVVNLPQGTAHALLRAPGLHNVRNALAAAAAAASLDISASAVGAGLERFCGIKGRLQVKRAASGAQVIDDTYNANPESMRAAVDVLAKSAGRKVLVIGDMGELGADAPRLHAEIGAYAKSAGIDELYALGGNAARAAAAFGAGAVHCAQIEKLIANLRASITADATVLVKGSRFMQMERVVAALADERSAACS